MFGKIEVGGGENNYENEFSMNSLDSSMIFRDPFNHIENNEDRRGSLSRHYA